MPVAEPGIDLTLRNNLTVSVTVIGNIFIYQSTRNRHAVKQIDYRSGSYIDDSLEAIEGRIQFGPSLSCICNLRKDIVVIWI